MKTLLTIVVFLSGLAIMAIGGGVGLGGFRTLGLQIDPDFFEVTNKAVFDVQDSHTRYLGGIFFMAGIVFVIGAFRIEKFRTSLIVLCLMIAGAAVFRFLGGDANLLSRELMPSLMLEILFAPLLAFWLWRSTQGDS